jgi:hypothetical protein
MLGLEVVSTLVRAAVHMLAQAGFICGSRQRPLCRAVWHHLSRTGGRLIHRPGRRNVFGAGWRNLFRTTASRSCRQLVIGSISQRRSKQLAPALMTRLPFLRSRHSPGWLVRLCNGVRILERLHALVA